MHGPQYRIARTLRFGVLEQVPSQEWPREQSVYVDVNCAYTRELVLAALRRRPWVRLLPRLDASCALVQIADFENIEWEPVLQGTHSAASYLVRKGLSRKAQLALQVRRHLSKHRDSALRQAVPFTLVLETWGAFEEQMKVDLGGGRFAAFDCGQSAALMSTPLRLRLAWCLEEAQSEVEHPDRADWLWILKPSVTNKGVDISLHATWPSVLGSLEAAPDIREWVLQKYIAKPLLLHGHKFHLRVYVLCVGALRVFVFNHILLLLAARAYDEADLEDIYRHLTNTARAAETDNFDEEKYVRVLDDLPSMLGLGLGPDGESAPADGRASVEAVRAQVHAITKDLFAAFENEYTVFAPMPQCFELYGLDFMIDAAWGVHLLEVNPGPDFVQTGDRLRRVVSGLWEQTCGIVLDGAQGGPDFSKVYDVEWSAAKIKPGGLAFQD